MTALKDISLSALAKGRTGYGVVKSGVNKKGDGEGYVDPYTLGVAFPTEVTDEAITERPNTGYKQLEMSVAQIQDDGSLKKGGKVWLDLPIPTAEEATEIAGIEAAIAENTMTADEEATLVASSAAYTRLAKTGDRFLKFMRAVAREQFSVFANVDKSNPKKWVYVGYDGATMSEKAREKRAAEIDAALIGFAEGLVDGTQSVKGAQFFMTKVANPNNAKYPYINFASAQS